MSGEKLKLVLLGEGRVGKTSLSSRFVSNSFNEGQTPTSAAAFLTKRVAINGSPCELAIWDTAGQERFHSLGPIYYRNADAAILVFDITDPDSFRRVRDWVRELRQMVGKDIPLTIAANKQDLLTPRMEGGVPDERSRAFAGSVGAAYFRTSARTGAGIEQAFTQTAQEALKYHVGKRAAAAGSSQTGIASMRQQSGDCGGVNLNEQRQSAAKSSCC